MHIAKIVMNRIHVPVLKLLISGVSLYNWQFAVLKWWSDSGIVIVFVTYVILAQLHLPERESNFQGYIEAESEESTEWVRALSLAGADSTEMHQKGQAPGKITDQEIHTPGLLCLVDLLHVFKGHSNQKTLMF